MKKNPSNRNTWRKMIVALLCLFSCSAIALGQGINVTGTVTNTAGEPLPGVHVRVQGSTGGTITDAAGKYNIIVTGKDNVLVYSFIGFVTREIPVGDKVLINVQLEEDTRGLEEVVVVGFATQRRINLTGAVSTVSARDLEARPVQNAVHALQGMIPGLNISTTGNGGELNASKSINIRGTGTVGGYTSGSPLILIDGMEGDINTLNPQDIETISVLKDAAASSIYGARAPFGVVLVTTKNGRAGKLVINYNNSFRYQTPVMLPEMANSWEFVNFFDDAEFNGSNNHLYTDSYKQKVKDYMDGKLEANDVVWSNDGSGMGSGGKWNYDYTNANVNWLTEYYKNWAPSQEHNLNVSGGTPALTYYLSTNYMTQNGFMRHGSDNYDRFTVTAKVSSQLTRYAKVDYSSRYVRTEFGRPTQWNSGFYDNVLRRARPVRAINDPNGYNMSDINYIDVMNDGGRHNELNEGLSQQARLTLTPLRDWNIIAELNVKTDNNWTHYEQLKTYAHYANNPEATYIPTTTSPTSDMVYEYAYKSTFLNPNVYTNYKFTVNDVHNVTMLAGFQVEQMKNRNLNADRADLINPDQPVLSLTTNSVANIGSTYQEWSTAGFFGRLNYDYAGRYLLEANIRYDGTSRYREGSRWVTSPSVSLGWNVANESFFENLAAYIQLLKLRVSYGTLANQNTGSWYPTYVTMSTGATNSRWLVDGARSNTASVPGLVSSTLTWETISNTNVGLNIAVLNNRLTGSFDYFVRKTKDMVGAALKLPSILGTSVPATNNTDLTTFGWELELAWRDQIGGFRYGARLTMSDSQTRIDRYANPTKNIGYYIEGELTGNIYGYTTVGIAKSDEEMQAHLATMPNGGQDAEGSRWTAGDIMYKDLNEDGKLHWGNDALDDMGDKSLLGNNTPRYRTGIHLDASWKGFDVQMFWQGVLKRDWMPAEGSLVFWGVTGSGQWWSTSFKDHLDYFRGDESHPLGQNLDPYYPRPLFNNKNHKPQTRYMQDASYMRLKNLQVGYTFPKEWTRRAKVESLRLFASGENLLTLTNLTRVMDPETAGIGAQGGTVYPLSSTYSFGLSVNF